MFNHAGRTRNAVRVSSAGLLCNVVNTLSNFVYRSLFLHFLSSAHLGLQGLFGDVLALLSLVSLGIDVVFVYQCYESLSRNDVRRIGQLMGFVRKTYWFIALVVVALGLALVPFLDVFILEGSAIPADVDLQIIYLLFLLQSAVSYVCTYRQILLKADQRQYILSIAGTFFNLVKYVVEISVLCFTRNFTLSLSMSIALTLLYNITFNLWVTHRYRPVFEIREKLPAEDRRKIYRETSAVLCHKVGGTVLNGTDSIVISRFVGLSANGLCSNYFLVFWGLYSILTSVIGNLTAMIGNAKIEQTEAQKYITFRRLIFLNFWMVGVISVCFYVLADGLVLAWLGDTMILSRMTLLPICIHFYLMTSRMINMSYTNGSGLFVKDRARPLIEAAINLVASIALVKRIGLPGVYWGTVISTLCTVFWREPYLLYKYEFRRSMGEYWEIFIRFLMITLLNTAGMSWIHSTFFAASSGFGMWLLEGAILFVLCNAVLCLFWMHSEEFCFFTALLQKEIRRVLNRGKRV